MASYYDSGRGSFLSAIPVVTKNLLIINLLLWVATFVMSGKGIDLNRYLALHFWQGSDFNLAQMVTYMFMHDTSSVQSGFLHIFCNMFNLWMFGVVLERTFGARRYLLYYLVCGVGAALVQELVWQLSWVNDVAGLLGMSTGQAEQLINSSSIGDLPMFLNNAYLTVGASGAVFGILLAFGMTFPNLPMYIIPFPFPIKAKWMVMGYGAVELIFGVTGSMSGVAHFAHLGGMLFGFLLILYWKRNGMTGGSGYGYMG